MKSYRQYCGVARSLDVVGDRWSLLVVRELLVAPRRFTELVAGLPGIPRNLLVERLRTLETAEVLRRDAEHYVLTERGAALKPVLQELIRWSFPLMVTGRGGDAVRGRWAGHAAEALFDGADLSGLDGLEVGVEADGEQLVLRVEGGRLRSTPERARDPDVTITGTMESVMATLLGMAPEHPVALDGDRRRLEELRGRCPGVPAS